MIHHDALDRNLEFIDVISDFLQHWSLSVGNWFFNCSENHAYPLIVIWEKNVIKFLTHSFSEMTSPVFERILVISQPHRFWKNICLTNNTLILIEHSYNVGCHSQSVATKSELCIVSEIAARLVSRLLAYFMNQRDKHNKRHIIL